MLVGLCGGRLAGPSGGGTYMHLSVSGSYIFKDSQAYKHRTVGTGIVCA